MADRRPPQFAAGERETLQRLLQFQRESLAQKVAGLDEEAADRPLVDSGTTLRWLVTHLAFAEQLWIVQRFAGEPMPEPALGTDGSMAIAVAAYEAAWQRVDEIVAGASLDDLCRGPEAPPVNLRWVLAHLLEETARHAGHADIIRELIDGRTGR